jgi:hypothetical protein
MEAAAGGGARAGEGGGGGGKNAAAPRPFLSPSKARPEELAEASPGPRPRGAGLASLARSPGVHARESLDAVRTSAASLGGASAYSADFDD